MLEQLTEKLARVVKTMRGQARLTEENMQEMLREVRLALLEADVALPVVRAFVARIKEQALGEDVAGSLTPGQALVGIVHKELTALMGGDVPPAERELSLATQPPAVILLAGLQGAGKTTTAAKLAKWLGDQKKKVMTVSTDVYRPAAIEQLRAVSAQAGASFFPSTAQDAPVDIARRALEQAQRQIFDVLIVDTAGRLAVDEAMMQEVAALHAALRPIETLFVIDAMLGQDAVNTARAFAERLPLTGVILTKLDGDARGGAALSVRHVTGKPVKFVGVAEKIGGLERFDPERMAGRVLGMGDIVSLVEDVQKSIDVKAAEKFAQRMKSGEKFDLNDFREQIGQMRKMGGISSMLDKLPAQFAQAAGQVNDQDVDKQVRRLEGIINSMTPAERVRPELIKASRKRRIATGSGVPVQEVNRLLNQFEQMQSMMKQMKKGGLAKMMRGLGGLGALKGGLPGLPKR
ncbi:MAG: signal recognition particle protein [Burkholderiaceae bacterium]|jgi:signal recognition particle subunit SRP54|nr:signal recognition particle protein [Burkholderiales bacterium]MCA3214725.1 signal recognition particle protein [Burkholderiales bacterium]MCA3221406.1 signal recognition particle protein [Burkholderiales bacterium]MCA3230019.1 signal recognition particle protein [Burkholderiales bacterium]MCE2644228.1 signal recognition particle protein [Burkholderiaceae bacterium]